MSCVKRCIKKVAGVRRISYTELQTLIMEIEAILNNRPICQDYDDELEDILTPNHLVYGRRLENVNEEKSCFIEGEGRLELVKREKHLARLVTYFWGVWRKEYLTSLRESQKMSKTPGATNLTEGDIHGCFKSHIAEIKRLFIFVRRSGTSLALKCKHGSSLDISFLSVTHTVNKCYSVIVFAPNDVGKGVSFIHKNNLRKNNVLSGL